MIKCEKIVKTYGEGDAAVDVLRGVSFEIKEGEFVAIMGPSGSGKSTLMHILGALDKPTSGKYFLDNKNISDLSDDDLALVRRDKIGFVFQSFNLLARTSVIRNVMLPLTYAEILIKERRKKAEKALKMASFEEAKWSNLSNQLSGGQMQRVAIARALVNDPSMILADEPTGNLDTKTGDMVMDTFSKLNKSGKTIVLITHEPLVAEKANRIIYIQDGEIK